LVSEWSGSLATGVRGNLALVPPGLLALAAALRLYHTAEASRLTRAAESGELLTSA